VALTAVVLCGGVATAQGTPLTLAAVLEALPRSAAWRASDQGVEAARRGVDAARGAAFGLSVGGDAGRSALASPGNPELNGVQWSGNVGATATLAVAPWSPVFDAVRGAERALKRAELDRMEARAGLTLEVVNRYFEARAAQASLEVSAGGVRLADARLRIARSQLALRTGTLEGVSAAEAALQSARAADAAATQGATVLRRALLLALGLPDADVTLPSVPVTRTVPTFAALQAALPASLARRVDVQRAVLAVDDANDALLIASRERWLPQASLNLSVGGAGANGQPGGAGANASLNLQNGTLSLGANYNFAPPSATQFTVSVNLGVGVIAPGADNRTRAAASALEAAQSNLIVARTNAEADILRAYATAASGAAQVGVAQSNLTLNQQRASDAERRLTLGVTTELERDLAALNTLQAERDLETARVNALLAALRLEIALGNTDLATILNGAQP
jgi:outer membrane protein TolC